MSNYDTDLFTPLIKRAAELTGTSLEEEAEREAKSKSAASLRVISDHARAATFLISDGVIPANEGRGYVLRKIIRRAIRHGRLLGQSKPFLYEMVFAVRDLMQEAYPELNGSAERVAKAVEAEEKRFAHMLDIGSRPLEEDLEQAHTERLLELRHQGIDADRAVVKYDGKKAFKLFETFGLPRDFIAAAVLDRGWVFDEAGFDQAMQEEQARARASWKGGAGKATASPVFLQFAAREVPALIHVAEQPPGYMTKSYPQSVFEGYERPETSTAKSYSLSDDDEGGA